MELYGRLARHFKYSVTEIRYRIKFAERFPDFERDFMEKFAHKWAKFPTWFEVRNEYLYDRGRDDNAIEEGRTPSLPKGFFDVIYADPPWEYEFGLRGGVQNHYPAMSLEELKSLRIPAAEDSVLFLWATMPKLREALELVEAWGFEYRTGAVWVKDRFGTGYYFRGQHELLLLSTKGTPLIPSEADRPSSVIEAPRSGHSRKPERVYELIERMFPKGRYLELFSRNVEGRKGWTMWGNEITAAARTIRDS
jgi:N6-adenosine-specific RNA methylase IME4